MFLVPKTQAQTLMPVYHPDMLDPTSSEAPNTNTFQHDVAIVTGLGVKGMIEKKMETV